MDKNELSQLIPEEINTHLQIFGRSHGKWTIIYLDLASSAIHE